MVTKMEYYRTNELYHHGIKGQRWGIRRFQNEDGSYTAAGKKRRAENYSDTQRTRDRKIYGKGAERRINNRMLKGESIQSARHNEVVRKQRIDSAKEIGKTTAKAALVVGAPIAVSKYLQKKGYSFKMADSIGDEAINIGRQVINAMLR